MLRSGSPKGRRRQARGRSRSFDNGVRAERPKHRTSITKRTTEGMSNEDAMDAAPRGMKPRGKSPPLPSERGSGGASVTVATVLSPGKIVPRPAFGTTRHGSRAQGFGNVSSSRMDQLARSEADEVPARPARGAGGGGLSGALAFGHPLSRPEGGRVARWGPSARPSRAVFRFP